VAIASAQSREAPSVPVAVYAAVAATMRNSGLMVTWLATLPLVPDAIRVSAV